MAERQERKRISAATIAWSAAAVILVLLFFGVRQLTRERLSLRVAIPQIEDLVKKTSAVGKVEPIGGFEAHAPIAAIVQAVYVHAGDHVPKGKLLLELNNKSAQAQVSAALAALRGAQANLAMVEGGGSQQQQLSLSGNIANAKLSRDQAARDLAAVQKLESQGAAAPNEVTQMQQRLDAANTTLDSLQQQHSKPFAPADLAHANSAVDEAQAAYSASLQTLEQCSVRAPYDGVVYSLPVSRYDFVQPGATLLSMADPAHMRVRAYFDEPDIGNLALGDPVTLGWNAKPDLSWHGRITALPSTIIPYNVTRNVGEVLVSIDGPEDGLLPNTNVTVTVITATVHNAMTVPLEALHIENGRDYVYVVAGDSLRRREVEVGARNETDMQILSGISKDSEVALDTTNGAPLQEGMPINILR
jgi:HlyD family secretion protein